MTKSFGLIGKWQIGEKCVMIKIKVNNKKWLLRVHNYYIWYTVRKTEYSYCESFSVSGKSSLERTRDLNNIIVTDTLEKSW